MGLTKSQIESLRNIPGLTVIGEADPESVPDATTSSDPQGVDFDTLIRRSAPPGFHRGIDPRTYIPDQNPYPTNLNAPKGS